MMESENRRLVLQLQNELDNAHQMHFDWAGNLGRWEWNYATGEVQYNDKKVLALGFAPGEVKFDVYDWTNRIHKDDYVATMKAMKDHLVGSTNVYECEYRILSKTGEYKWFYDRGKIVEYGPQGQPLRIVGIVFDVTEKKLIEERLRADLDFRSKVLAVISHDFRGPLAASISILRSIVSHLSEEDQELVNVLIKAQSEMTNNIEKIVDWSKTSIFSQTPRERQKIDVLCREQIELLQPMIQEKRLNVGFDSDASCDICLCKEVFELVVRNVMINAIKYSKEGGTVFLEVRDKSDKLVVTVQDEGVGIDPEKLRKINDNEYVVSKKGTSGEKGTGLGLLICKDMLSRAQGKFSIESSCGVGTKVTIEFEKG